MAKKVPQSDNNSNLYADVKKSGRQDTSKGAMSFEVKPRKGTSQTKLLIMLSSKVNKF